MMNYEQFKEKLVAEFKNYLPEEYKAFDLELHTVDKINRKKECITLKGEGRTSAPTLYIEEAYEHYITHDDFDKAVTELAGFVVDALETAPNITVKDLVESKDRIVYQLINTEWNKELLDNVPHREFLDLSIIYRILIETSESESMATIVHNAMAEMMGLTEEELFELAKANTERILPADVMEIMCLGIEEGHGMYVITNENALNGAISMLHTDVLHKLAEKMDSDLYILPASVHEVIAVPTDGPLEKLLDTVKEVNEEAVVLQDRLSDSVYHYNRASKEITLATKENEHE